MKIRRAEFPRDREAVIRGAEAFAATVEFQRWMPDDFSGVVDGWLSADAVTILVGETDHVIGGIGYIVAPYHWNPAITIADELFWWVGDNAPFSAAYRLAVEALRDIRSRGAEPVMKALRTSPEGVSRLYRKHGLAPVETTYVRL